MKKLLLIPVFVLTCVNYSIAQNFSYQYGSSTHEDELQEGHLTLSGTGHILVGNTKDASGQSIALAVQTDLNGTPITNKTYTFTDFFSPFNTYHSEVMSVTELPNGDFVMAGRVYTQKGVDEDIFVARLKRNALTIPHHWSSTLFIAHKWDLGGNLETINQIYYDIHTDHLFATGYTQKTPVNGSSGKELFIIEFATDYNMDQPILPIWNAKYQSNIGVSDNWIEGNGLLVDNYVVPTNNRLIVVGDIGGNTSSTPPTHHEQFGFALWIDLGSKTLINSNVYTSSLGGISNSTSLSFKSVEPSAQHGSMYNADGYVIAGWKQKGNTIQPSFPGSIQGHFPQFMVLRMDMNGSIDWVNQWNSFNNNYECMEYSIAYDAKEFIDDQTYLPNYYAVGEYVANCTTPKAAMLNHYEGNRGRLKQAYLYDVNNINDYAYSCQVNGTDFYTYATSAQTPMATSSEFDLIRFDMNTPNLCNLDSNGNRVDSTHLYPNNVTLPNQYMSANISDLDYSIDSVGSSLLCSRTIGHKPSNSSILSNLPTTVENVTFNAIPNPVINDLTISFQLPSTEYLKFQLTNCSGDVLYISPVKEYSASNHNILIPMENLPKGIYFYNVTNSSGQQIHIGKLVKL